MCNHYYISYNDYRLTVLADMGLYGYVDDVYGADSNTGTLIDMHPTLQYVCVHTIIMPSWSCNRNIHYTFKHVIFPSCEHICTSTWWSGHGEIHQTSGSSEN